MDTWDSCWSRSGYSASYLRNIPSLHITHLIILRSLFQSWFAVKRHLIFAVWVGSGRSGFRRRNILIFTCKVPHATPSPKVQFPGVILNPNEAVLSCMDSNFALIFWIQCCRRYHRATQNPVLQRNPLSCMESSFALSCTHSFWLMEYSKSSDLLCTFQKHDALENWILPPCPSVTTLVRISVFVDKTEPSKQDSIHEFLRNNFPVGFQSLHQTQNPHRVQNRFGNKLV